MTFEGADNTLAMADHADHIHVGFQPLYGANTKLGRQLDAVLKPSQWIKLIDRLGQDRQPDGARSSRRSTRCARSSGRRATSPPAPSHGEAHPASRKRSARARKKSRRMITPTTWPSSTTGSSSTR